MEFQYRSGDQSSRTPTMPVECHGESSAKPPSTSTPPLPASDPDELRRQAAKERIRERILREEEDLALEAEDRRELMEERFTLLRSGLARPSPCAARSEGAEARTSPPVAMTADSPSPTVLEPLQPRPVANGPAALPAKRKNSDDVTRTSNVSAATSGSKKQKPDLTCTVCGITLNDEKPMLDHLKGKSHIRKAAMIAPSMPVAEHNENEEEDVSMQPRPVADGSAALPVKWNNSDDVTRTSTVSAATSSKKQKPGLSCTVCDITLNGKKPLKEHLKGKSHMRKAAMIAPSMLVAKHDENEEEDVILSEANASAAAAASTVLAAAGSLKQKQDLTCTLCGVTSTSEKSLQYHLRGKSHQKKAAALALPPPLPEAAEHEKEGDYTPKKLIVGTKRYEVMQMNGFVLCEVCPVRTRDLVTMMRHLDGRKHTSKVLQKQGVEGRRVAPPATTTNAVAGGDPGEVKKVDVPAAAAATGVGGREAVFADEAKSHEDSIVVAGSNDSVVLGDDVACAGATVALMEAVEHAEVSDATAIAEAENTAAGTVTPLAREVKIQVEGKVFTVLHQAASTPGSTGSASVSRRGEGRAGVAAAAVTASHRGNDSGGKMVVDDQI